MIGFIKKYWDIIGGASAGLLLTIVAEFELEWVQLCYSVIILMFACIAVFRSIKQTIEKNRESRKRNVIDSMVDSQKAVKAIKMAQDPTKEGEKVGKLVIDIWRFIKKHMHNIKEFFSKFKGYITTVALGILTAVEAYGGYINSIFGGKFTINEVEVLPMVTLACTVVVGILSNGYTKDQKEKIKALFSKATTNELVVEGIKKSIKDSNTKLSQLNKQLTAKEHELANFSKELETAQNNLQAKKEMYAMTPQLASAEDVNTAASAVTECEVKISNTQCEIDDVKAKIDEVTAHLTALKSKL